VNHWNSQSIATPGQIGKNLKEAKEMAYGKIDPNVEILLTKLSQWTSDPAQLYENAIAINQKLNSACMSVCEDQRNENFGITMVRPGVKMQNQDKKVFMIECVGTVFLKGKEITLQVKSVYSSPKDVQWCQQACMTYQAKLKEANR
jgi:hypothetical protein